MKKDNNKIALGTAQFSNNYGITNKKKFSSNAIRNILEKSIELKIKTIDTAPNYQKVEKKLGENNLEKFQLVDITSHFNGKKRFSEKWFVVPYDIPQNNVATYFPESNSLIPLESVADKSNTPTSKSVVVTINKSKI